MTASNNNADFLGSGWVFPLRADFANEDSDNPQIALSSGEANIEESIRIILSTSQGERVMRPNFGCGLNRLIFAPINASTVGQITYHIRTALTEWEPRIDNIGVEVSLDSEEESRININVSYTVRSTNNRRNLVYPFYLESAK